MGRMYSISKNEKYHKNFKFKEPLYINKRDVYNIKGRWIKIPKIHKRY